MSIYTILVVVQVEFCQTNDYFFSFFPPTLKKLAPIPKTKNRIFSSVTQQVHVLQGRNYPTGINGSQVRLVLLPSKKQRRKTRVRQGGSPQFMESFLLPRVNPEDVNAMGIRVRVYTWSGRMRRERLLGEARVSFDCINLRLETTLWLTLQPPPSSSVSFTF